MDSTDHFAKSSWMMTVGSIALVVAVLYLAKGVLIPLTLVVLLSFLLAPVCDWLERRGIRRLPAVMLTVIFSFLALGAVAWTAAVQITALAPKLPQYENNIVAKMNWMNNFSISAIRNLRRTSKDITQKLSHPDTAEEPGSAEQPPTEVRVISAPPSPLQTIGGMFNQIIGVLGSIFLVMVLVTFFLIQRKDLRDRFISLMGRGEVTLTTQTLEDATSRVSRYLIVQLIINASYGLSIAIGLYFIDIPNAILWGILTALLRFVPYIGAWISAGPPIILSLAISASWMQPVLTIVLFAFLELFISNVIEPWLYGKNTGVSPVAVLLAALFWSWLWGAVGLLLATPLTVCLLVIGKHVPQLAFLETLLGTEPVFEPHKRVYQRLLAGDQEEASELLLDDLETRPLVEVYDTVLIPALARTETHWHRDELDGKRHAFIFQSLRTSIEEMGEHQREVEARAKASQSDGKEADSEPTPPPPTVPTKLDVLCLPAYDEADEIAGMMLAQVLEFNGCQVQVAPVAARISETIELVMQSKPDVVCISATPPAAVVHARYLCKRLQGRFPGAHLVVGLWDAKRDLAVAKERIGCGASAKIAVTLAEAQEQVRGLLHPLSVQAPVELPKEDGRVFTDDLLSSAPTRA